jgi:hypothetical protein
VRTWCTADRRRDITCPVHAGLNSGEMLHRPESAFKAA